MKKNLAIIILGVLFSCTENKKSNSIANNSIDSLHPNTEKVLIDNEPKKETELEQLKTEASRLKGGGSIKSVELQNGKAKITYVKNYTEYKKLNPQSGLTENNLNEYWSSGDAIQKALVDGSVRLMKKLNFVEEVEIILPFKTKIHRIDVEKKELEKFIGKDFSKITNTWTKSFIDPYVYDKNGREKFLRKFGNIN